MPIVKAGPYDIDYAEAGAGPPVLLLHSSAAGNRQWRKLMEERAAKNRLIAINLFGYGVTSKWLNEQPLTLGDQANLVIATAHFAPGPLALVGHSLGGAVAMEAALRLGDRLRVLIVYEPILFYLLRLHGELEAFAEIDAVRRGYIEAREKQDWDAAARLFIDFWSGHGAWDATADDRKARMLDTLPALMHEWQTVGTDGPPLDHWSAIQAPVHVVRAADTRRPTRAITEILRAEYPRWHFHEVAAGGHTAPITRPDLVNPVLAKILDETA